MLEDAAGTQQHRRRATWLDLTTTRLCRKVGDNQSQPGQQPNQRFRAIACGTMDTTVRYRTGESGIEVSEGTWHGQSKQVY
jgi:hypothetical protein